MNQDQKNGGGVVVKKPDKPDSDVVVQKKKEASEFGSATRQFMDYLANNCHGCGM